VQFEYEQSAFPMDRLPNLKVSRKREETAMAGKITTLLNTLTLSDVEAMAPTDRRSFGERCRFWAHLVELTRIDSEGSGVLAELRQGYRVD